MNAYEMEITPAQAKEFLKLNSTNRPLRPTWVKTLKGIIERGEWKVTHQGIAITTENTLLDGQHRLLAIAESGKTVNMQVSFDCDPTTFMVLDNGVKRTVQDQLGIPLMVGALARLLWKLPKRTDNTIPTSAQIDAVLGWSRDVIDEVAEVAGGKSKFSNAPVQLAIAVHVMAGRSEVLEKFHAFRSLDFDAMPSSVKALAKQIIEGKASTRSDQWDITARAWRAFDPANWQIPRVQIKNIDASIGEMNKVVDQFRARRAKQFRKAA